jgi:hypothetical protein
MNQFVFTAVVAGDLMCLRDGGGKLLPIILQDDGGSQITALQDIGKDCSVPPDLEEGEAIRIDGKFETCYGSLVLNVTGVTRVSGEKEEVTMTIPLEDMPSAAPAAVERPAHYTFGKYEVIDVLEDWFKSDPLLWQTGKYLARAGRKGPMLEDLLKARWYLQRRIDKEAVKDAEIG